MQDIFVLANTILFSDAASGGDIIFPQLQSYLGERSRVTVVGHRFVRDLWRNFGVKKAHYQVFSDILFDSNEAVQFGSIKYLTRTVQAIISLITVIGNKQLENPVFYSSSDLFPDVIPAFIGKVIRPNSRWIACVYHVNNSPFQRRGSRIYASFSFFAQRIGFFFIKRAANTIVVLQGVEDDLLELGFSKNKLVTSYAGVDVQRIRSAERYPESFDAITIGNINDTRGIFELVPIWAGVVRLMPRARLAIVGGGSRSDIQKLKKSVRRKKLLKNITVFGHIKNRDLLFGILKSSHIHLCTRMEGGASLPILEAMAVGIPTVAYALPALVKTYNQQVQFVSVGDRQSFINHITDLLKNTRKWTVWSTKAKKSVSRYDLNKIKSDFLQLFT